MVTVRNIMRDDYPYLSLLMGELGYPASSGEIESRFYKISHHDDYQSLVAVTGDNEVAGFIGLIKNHYFEHNGCYVRVGALVVGEKFRNLGIGKKLIQEAENWAAYIGATAILLNSGNREERLGAYAFYQKMGFVVKSHGFVKYLDPADRGSVV